MKSPNVRFKIFTMMLHTCVVWNMSSCSSPVNLTTSSSSKMDKTQDTAADPFALTPITESKDETGSNSSEKSSAADCKNCNGYLLVMLNAPGQTAHSYRAFTKEMIESGFRILNYESASNPSDLTESTDHLLQRLRSDLNLLARSDQKWKEFVTFEGEPAWGKIAFNGIGPSAMIALNIAQKKRLARVCSFHGPWAITPDGATAPWLSQTFATPVRRLNFMIHKHEGGKDSMAKFEMILRKMSISEHLSSWTRLETNALYASLQGQSCKDPSSCLIQDPIPTDESSRPIYQQAWRHLCVPPSMSDFN
jgi:hypothetical protein